MVDPQRFKQKVELLLPQDHKIEFLGENTDKIITQLSETKAEKIYNWVQESVSENVQPILILSNKNYKEWKARDLLTFRYPFSIENTEYRILLVKVKNSFFIEFHLGNHKYYDKIRKDLDLKK